MGDDDPCQFPGCTLTRAEHEFDEDPAVFERAEFERAVARRVEEKLAEHRYLAALVEHKLAIVRGDSSVPRPRTDDLDRLEHARIKVLADAREVQRRVAQKIQASRGEKAEFITNPNAPSREEWAAGLSKSVGGFEVKDASDVLYREA